MAKIFILTERSGPSVDAASGTWLDDSKLVEFEFHSNSQDEKVAFPPRCSVYATDWTNQELADLFRAHTLIQSARPGLECDRGLSDDGDPWFVIGDAQGDVLVHICRIGSDYILDSVALPQVLSGRNFNTLVEKFLNMAGAGTRGSEAANVVRLSRGGKVLLHPSMMLAALVWTLLSDADELILPSGPAESSGRDFPGSSSEASADLPGERPDDVSYQDLQERPHFIPQVAASALDKEDKQLSQPSFGQAHALTTVAVGIGLYSAADAFGSYRGLTRDQDPSEDLVDGEYAGGVNTNLGVLSPAFLQLTEAFALLSLVSDIDLFDVQGKLGETASEVKSPTEDDPYAVQQDATDTPVKRPPDLIEAQNGQSEGLGGVSVTQQHAYVPTTDSAYLSEHGRAIATNAQAREEPGTIQEVTQYLISKNFDVSQYQAVSLEAGVGLYGGELQSLYASISAEFLPEIEIGADAGEGYDPSLADAPEDLLALFDDEARIFLDEQLALGDLEILVFAQEILLIDPDAFLTDYAAISWQLEDGAVISFIGVSSDIEDYLVA